MAKISPNSRRMTPNGKQLNYVCIYCKNSYSNAGNLGKHKLVCSEKKLYLSNYNVQVSEFSKKAEEYEKLLAQKDETIGILKAEVAHLKTIVNSTGTILKNSVSTVAFIIKNYNDAPVLEKIDVHNSLLYEQSEEFIDDILYNYNHKKLDAYIGDFIIKTYKKDDPTKQSIWNSDTSRLTYIIREIIANNKVDWRVDKKGIKTTTHIITPIIEHIKEKLNCYLKNNNDTTNINLHLDNLDKFRSITEILKIIDDNILSEQVLKYIAPYFYLDKLDKLDKPNKLNLPCNYDMVSNIDNE